ncbi:MAG: pyridoxamine 5'-phosphate oxidase [Alphaproteobacteria bacterium]|jgi:pyridoxamine 5'-phosphate oxidase|tara:strand:- start:1247 stop:1870 length:624 start_codon:yes stop_codon:yes gene_type:complete
MKQISNIDFSNNSFSNKTNPLALFEEWIKEAESQELNDPNAMILATSDSDNIPNARVVLLKDYGTKGFTFYTNANSAKGKELSQNKSVAACFHWKSLQRQIRIKGKVEILSNSESEAYFKTRPRGSQIGAWASKQSSDLESQSQLKSSFSDIELIYEDKDVPKPPYWMGYRIVPNEIEFWVNSEFRLHQRLVFYLENNKWNTKFLYP